MKIYTKSGDKGQTSLANGQRVGKDNLRIEAYGTADELNSFVGLVRCMLDDDEVQMNFIQNKLFNLGALLSEAPGDWISDDDVIMLEQWIDQMQAEQQPLNAFVLPAGNQAVCYCHVCRTITRRLERLMVSLQNNNTNIPQTAMQWVNRLSDFWFVKALQQAKKHNSALIFWKK
jgi:cob(I)alamin adenosyltransferase